MAFALLFVRTGPLPIVFGSVEGSVLQENVERIDLHRVRAKDETTGDTAELEAVRHTVSPVWRNTHLEFTHPAQNFLLEEPFQPIEA